MVQAEPEERQPGMLMALLLARFMWFDGALQESLEARGWGGVRRLESMTMIYVQSGVQRPSALARLIGVTRQSMHTALKELEEKNLIRLVPDPEDKRCKIVEFAPEGAPMREEAASILSGLEKRLEENLGAAALSELRFILNADWGEPGTKAARQGPRRGKMT